MPSKMHSTTRPMFNSFKLKMLSAAVASALVFSNAEAAGLGKLSVLSSLGQPLRAEIELTSVSKDEVGTLAAKLASAEAFRQASIDFNPALMSLRFAVEQRNERYFIRITSSQPLNEPFVDMLLELSGPNGRLVREYTFLLDPPELRASQSAQVVTGQAADVAIGNAPQKDPQSDAPLPAASTGKTADLAKRSLESPNSQKARQTATAAPTGADKSFRAEEYEVRVGDSLAKIARELKPNSVSLDQMLVALYQANPDAFIDKNMNRLKAGQILTVPSSETASSISQSEAHNIVLAQSADFNNYRSKLAGRVAGAAPQRSADMKQSASGKISAQVQEQPTAANESKDKLKLSNARALEKNGGNNASAAATAEEKIAKEKAIAEANARVKELEKNVNDLHKLLEVKNKSLADQQKQLDTPKGNAQPSALPAPAQTSAATPAPSSPVVPATTTATKIETPAAPSIPPSIAQTDKVSPPAVEAKSSTPPAAVEKVEKALPTKPVPAPTPPSSFIDELMDNPFTLYGVGALLAGLGALGIYNAKRRKQNKQFEDSIITDSSLKANSLFGSTGGQSVDTNNSVFNSSFAPTASQLDTNEVDPVAEADVYIAYGRDAQAEEILKEALRTQPDRHAVRVKLLEIYSNRKDLRAFEVLATELYGLTKGEGEEWAQAAALGIAIDPNNPLYASGNAAKDGTIASNDLVAPTQPLEEQGLATLLADTQSDTSVNTISELGADTSYFSNTALAAEAPMNPINSDSPDLSAAPVTEESNGEVNSTAEKPVSSELDFDLEGMNLQDVLVPNTIPRPASSEPGPDLASIDFDFLEASAAKEEVTEPKEAEIASSVSLEDFSASVDEEISIPQNSTLQSESFAAVGEVTSESLKIEIPELTEEPEATSLPAEGADPLDFDLSGISLELNQAEAALKTEVAGQLTDEPEQGSDVLSSVDAEMATKLDLALAYQEIGDKEGARELLDEVLKGGTAEQSEKAKNLLLELA